MSPTRRDIVKLGTALGLGATMPTGAERIAAMQVLNRRLRVMDSTAITFCMDNKLPIVVFDLMAPGNIRRALQGEPIGTLVT